MLLKFKPASPAREIWRVNAFTDTPFTGNPAGVVPQADGLSPQEMLHISVELNSISETAFISASNKPGADLRLRYYTSTTEVDLCGHATMSALFVLHWTGQITGEDETVTLKAETNVGVLELGLTFEGGTLIHATMEQLVPEIHIAPQLELVPAVLGLTPDDLLPGLLPGCASTGLWACFVPLRTQDALARIKINREIISEIWPENPDFTGIYPFTFVDNQTTQGRFFSPPKYGIVEDPATGTACGALGAYLLDKGRFPESGVLYARQGVEMGRPSLVQVTQNPNGRMAVSGKVVPIYRGEMLT